MESNKSIRRRLPGITRRNFLKTLVGVGVGYFYFHYIPLDIPLANNSSNPEQTPPSLLKGDKTAPLRLSTRSGSSALSTRPASPAPSTRPVSSVFSTTQVLPNAPTYTITPTYDRSGQAVHPSVIDFKAEYGLESWGGFRYWMALTPYPDFDYTLENPSLLVSQDGVTWHDPPAIKNPVVPRPFDFLLATYNSDPELIYDPDQDTLLLYWREYQRSGWERIWAKRIRSRHESARILCLENQWHPGGGMVLSPTVWRQSSNRWIMWTTNGDTLIHLYTSSNGVNWSSGVPCSTPWNTWNGGYIPWHVAAKPNHPEQKIEFLIAGWPKSAWLNHCELLYATAPMSEPTNLSMPLQQPLLRASGQNQWDNGFIYRSSFVPEPGDSPKFRIWYSACSKKKVWHIGYTEGRLAKITSSYA